MNTHTSAFSSWLDDFFSAYYRRRPVNATFVGLHGLDHHLPDFSEKGVADTVAEMQALLTRLDTLPPENLTASESLDRRLAAGYLRTQLWEFQSQHFYQGNPCLYTGEAVFGVMALFLTDFAPVGERVAAAIDRMNGIPALLAQGQSNLRQAPQAWIEHTLNECVGALAFFGPGIDQARMIHEPEFAGALFFQKTLADEVLDDAGDQSRAGLGAVKQFALRPDPVAIG